MKQLKKPIKVLLLSVAAVMFLQQTEAQRFSIAVQSGISGGIANAPLHPPLTYSESPYLPLLDLEENNNNVFFNYKESSYGKSWNIAVVPSITFDKGFGFRLGTAYHGGLNTLTSGALGSTSFSAKTRADYWSLNPAVFFELPINKFRPYIQLGAAFAFPQITTIQKVTGGQNESILTDRVSGNVGIGIAGALGAEYAASDKIGIFGELSFLSMSYKGKKVELNLTKNGADITVDAFGSKEKTLVDNAPTGFSGNEWLRTSQPFSNIGFNAGVRFYF